MEKYKKIVPLSVHKSVFDKVLDQNPLKLVVLSDSSNLFFFHATKEDQAKFFKSYLKYQNFAVGVNSIFDKKAVEVIEIDYNFKDIPLVEAKDRSISRLSEKGPITKSQLSIKAAGSENKIFQKSDNQVSPKERMAAVMG